MLIEWFWKYEYFVNFINMWHGAKKYVIYGHLYKLLSLVITDKLNIVHLPPIRRLSEIAWFLSPSPYQRVPDHPSP